MCSKTRRPLRNKTVNCLLDVTPSSRKLRRSRRKHPARQALIKECPPSPLPILPKANRVLLLYPLRTPLVIPKCPNRPRLNFRLTLLIVLFPTANWFCHRQRCRPGHHRHLMRRAKCGLHLGLFEQIKYAILFCRSSCKTRRVVSPILSEDHPRSLLLWTQVSYLIMSWPRTRTRRLKK